ncbi:MAG TPA: hypothetical protein VG964_04140 [Candidatus Saccharimonadales bacterium]|nr:hypothetical protein [Candidatus Saccharimonadales bacterium]
MKADKDNSMFLLGGVVAVIIGFIASSMFVHAPKTGSIKVDKVPAIPANFPDVKNDTTYSNFLNNKAIDPTQSIQLGNSNTTPFNSSTGR